MVTPALTGQSPAEKAAPATYSVPKTAPFWRPRPEPPPIPVVHVIDLQCAVLGLAVVYSHITA